MKKTFIFIMILCICGMILQGCDKVKVKSIAAGQNYSLVLMSNGELWAAGRNDYDKAGIKDEEKINVFLRVLQGVEAVSAGEGHTLVLKNGGILAGAGDAMKFGKPDPAITANTEEKGIWVNLMEDVKKISAGRTHSLVVKNDGSLWGVGYNTWGSLGTEEYVELYHNFVRVLENVNAAWAGMSHSLALKDDGTLWVTGYNNSGELGIGCEEAEEYDEEMDHRHIRKWTYAADGVKAAAAGSSYSLILKKDGTLWAAGNNSWGKLGTGDRKERCEFVRVLTEVSSMAAGGSHSMAVKKDGTLWVAGNNEHGQLGTGDIENRYEFTEVLADVSSVAAGETHSMALKKDGSLWVTGGNFYGALGLSDNEDRNTWTRVLLSE
ncbi:MAG: RCC1 domain-containing protein [Candidatus Goldiibacteriota bacterium]